MASISHTVGGTENLVSFKSAVRVPITSLKAHFKPIQEGEGNPSPDNVRPIVGWNGANVYKSGKNLFDMNSLSNQKNIREENNFYYNTVADTRDYTNIYLEFWDVLSTTFVTRLQNVAKLLSSNGKTSFVFTIKEECKDAKVIRIKYNGQKQDFIIGTWSFNLQIGHTYTCSMDVTGFDATVIGGFSVGNIQIEEGSIATPYEPYQGETIPITFPVLGKNKFNPNCSMISSSGIYSNANGVITQIGSDGRAWTNDSSFPPFDLLAGTYTISSSDNCIINLATSIDNYQTVYRFQNKPGSFILSEDCQVKFKCSGTYPLEHTIQIEYGDTATTYEPYNSNNTVYGGYVDLVKGELVQEWKIIDLGTLNWSYAATYSSSYPNWPHFYNSDLKDKKQGWNNGITSMYPLVNSKYDRTKDLAFTCTGYHSSYEICIRDTRYTTLEDFEMAINGIQYCYELNEPIHYPLSSQELTTFLNQNNIWTSTNDVTELSYAIHDTAPIRAARKRIQAAAPGLKTQEGEMINFETDVPAPLKECKAYFKPKQDFNGYDRPWPAGGGKNIAKPYDNNYVSSTYISFDYSAANGTFRCYGTASASSTHSSPSATNAVNNGATFTLPAGTYTLSIIDGDGTYIYAQCVSLTETVLAETTSYISFTTNEALTVFVRLKVAAGATVDNTVKIQLEQGSIATSYEPYENICPIEGWESFEATRCGKNLCNENTLLNGYIRGAVTSTGTEIGAFGFSSEWKATDFIKVLPNTVYTINFSWVMALAAGLAFYKEPTVNSAISGISTMQMGKAPFTFTTPLNCNYVRFCSHKEDDTVMSLELDDTATEYEPYNGTTIPITFPTEAGTIYGGYVDLVRGEIVATHGIITLIGTEITWGYKTYWGGMITVSASPVLLSATACSIVPCMDELTPAVAGRINKCVAQKRNDTLTVIGFGLVDTYPDLQSFLNYVQEQYTNGTPVQVIGPLETPITYSLTQQQLKTLRGQNNIWSSANDKLEIKYWKH